MDLQEIWEQIDNRVDWFIAGIIALFVANIAAIFILAGIYLKEEDFFQQHNLQPTGDIEEQLAILEKIPELEEIDIPEHEEAGDLPEKFVELHGSELFIPLPQRDRTPDILEEPVMGDDGETTEIVRRDPLVEGYQIVGRVIDQDKEIKIGMLKKEEDGSIFIAREGEYLDGTDIQILDISDTIIRIDRPEHRVTELQFDVDKMSQEIEQFIKQH
ncbi:MAG: hypothetical protein ACLFN5_03300 [bacterium]